MSERICETPTCDEKIAPATGRARPRKFCLTCRPRKASSATVVDLPKRPVADPPTIDVLAAYRVKLEESGVVDTPEGQHVLLLAHSMAEGQHSTSGLAALSKELRAALAAAVADTEQQGDRLDEIAARRAMKASGA